MGDVAKHTLVPDSETLKQRDILTRANLTSAKARTGSRCLLKGEYPWGSSFKIQRENDEKRYGIVLPEYKLNFLPNHILDNDFRLTLSYGKKLSVDRIIEFFEGAIGRSVGITRSVRPPEEKRR
ncbi:unnamed protein product [marine sediment metagenome]|uniref:Uncharacterized protein n=1 Tax=marine sediment metagenome TaxID=412755 RepID=X1BCW5_9ZZZZ